jgi:hypothetical protein
MRYNQSRNAGSVKPPSGNFRYPNVEYTKDMDYVRINLHDYIAPFSTQGNQIITNETGLAFSSYNKSSDGLGKATSTLYLYMPEDMEGEYGGNWDAQNLSNVTRGVLGGFGDAAGDKVGSGINKLLDAAKTGGDNLLTKGTGVANAISSILGATNFGSVTVNDIFSVTTGQILNPNTEVLYKGPKMRTFNLSFKMAPRNSKEAEQIKSIIHALKFATLPKFGGKGGDKSASFVRLPQIADVTFMKGNTEHDWVTQFKPSVISNLNISYTPDGAWATLPNGSPVATKIDISFQETKMVYADELIKDKASY